MKKFPCCRWSHPAIAAALTLRAEAAIQPAEVLRVAVRTFAEAAAIARRAPTTTEEAQYSPVWPVAVALAHGKFSVEHVLEPALSNPLATDLLRRVEIEVDPVFSSVFPSRRLASATVETAGGGSYSSDPTEPPGEPDDPQLVEIVDAKYGRFAGQAANELPRLLLDAAAAA